MTTLPISLTASHQIRAALKHLQAVLADAGIQSGDHRVDPIEAELRRFDEHMRQAQGFAKSTCLRRMAIVRSLVCETVSITPTAEELRHFIAQELMRLSPASAGALTTALRGYLRFRAFEGDRVEHLLPVIASPARWRLAPLPQTLSRNELAQLLEAFPRELPSRLRSYAIVRCVVDLGLRSSEVISLYKFVRARYHRHKCQTARFPVAEATFRNRRKVLRYSTLARSLSSSRFRGNPRHQMTMRLTERHECLAGNREAARSEDESHLLS